MNCGALFPPDCHRRPPPPPRPPPIPTLPHGFALDITGSGHCCGAACCQQTRTLADSFPAASECSRWCDPAGSSHESQTRKYFTLQFLLRSTDCSLCRLAEARHLQGQSCLFKQGKPCLSRQGQSCLSMQGQPCPFISPALSSVLPFPSSHCSRQALTTLNHTLCPLYTARL